MYLTVQVNSYWNFLWQIFVLLTCCVPVDKKERWHGRPLIQSKGVLQLNDYCLFLNCTSFWMSSRTLWNCNNYFTIEISPSLSFANIIEGYIGYIFWQENNVYVKVQEHESWNHFITYNGTDEKFMFRISLDLKKSHKDMERINAWYWVKTVRQ